MLIFAATTLLGNETSTLRVLVLDTESIQLDADVSRSVTGSIASVLATYGTLEVVTTMDIDRMLALEEQKEMLGCRTQDCFAQLAGALGARLLVLSDAAMLDDLFVLHISFLDVKRVRTLARHTLRTPNLNEIPDRLEDQLETAMAEALTQLGVEQTTEFEESRESSDGHPWWRWGGILSGVAVGGLGLAFDLTATSSSNGRLEGADFVGPAMYVAGAALIAAGVWLNPYGASAEPVELVAPDPMVPDASPR